MKDKLLNMALMAIVAVGGLVIFSPANEPHTRFEVASNAIDLGQVAEGDSEDGVYHWYSPRIWDMVEDEMISPDGDHSIIFPPHEPGNKWAIILLTHND